jgi:hypothetical protein
MSGRGGIYRGPNGEELYGDGREVSPSVAPGEAQREPIIKSVRHVPGTIHGYNYGPPQNLAVGWLPGVNVLAVPSEVAPSREQLLEDALRRASILLRACPPTVRGVFEAGDKAIDAAGLNPWCINEGLASGDEEIDTWFIDAALEGK